MTDVSKAPISAPPVRDVNKMFAAGGASTIAGALTTVIIGVINGLDPSYHMTDTLQGAITTLVTAALAMLAVYLTPHSS